MKTTAHRVVNPILRVIDPALGLGDKSMDKQLVVTSGFKILGPAAAPAIPELQRILRASYINKMISTADLAEVSLAYIGQPAVPSVTAMLGDPNPEIREAATNLLRKIAPEALTNALPQ